ncbi:hypothetical protein FB451DRAFT_164572 [Mycena latifolia]|nr:hypothetical protein FB451DRAFT_164572 [Mycena latifolia]
MSPRPQQPGVRKPTASESSALATDRARVAELDAQTLALKLSIRSLRNKRKMVQDRLDAYKYPVLTLPYEIVSEIFVHALPAYPIRPPLVGFLSTVELGLICHEWREITLSTPRLWRAFSIEATWASSSSSAYRYLQACLARSGSLPLSISISLRTSIIDAANLIDTMVDHCARWEYIELGHMEMRDFRRLEGKMPLLRCLDFSASPGHPNSLLRAFHEAPQLQSISLCHDFNPSMITLPWAQLTTLSLTSWTSVVLDETVSLIQCDVRVSRFSNRVPLKPLASLQSLRARLVDNNDNEPYPDFINTLALPALRRLDISEQLLGSAPLIVLRALVSKSGCNIQTLRISRTRSYRREYHIPNFLYRNAFPTIHISFALDSDPDEEESSDSDEEESSDEESEDEELGGGQSGGLGSDDQSE